MKIFEEKAKCSHVYNSLLLWGIRRGGIDALGHLDKRCDDLGLRWLESSLRVAEPILLTAYPFHVGGIDLYHFVVRGIYISWLIRYLDTRIHFYY